MKEIPVAIIMPAGRLNGLPIRIEIIVAEKLDSRKGAIGVEPEQQRQADDIILNISESP